MDQDTLPENKTILSAPNRFRAQTLFNFPQTRQHISCSEYFFTCFIQLFLSDVALCIFFNSIIRCSFVKCTSIIFTYFIFLDRDLEFHPCFLIFQGQQAKCCIVSSNFFFRKFPYHYIYILHLQSR